MGKCTSRHRFSYGGLEVIKLEIAKFIYITNSKKKNINIPTLCYEPRIKK